MREDEVTILVRNLPTSSYKYKSRAPYLQVLFHNFKNIFIDKVMEGCALTTSSIPTSWAQTCFWAETQIVT